MSRRSRAATDPRTLASIALGKSWRKECAAGWVTLYACGCDGYVDKDSLYLCAYHSGFTDALGLGEEAV